MAEYNPSKIIKGGNTYNFRDTTKIPLAGSNEISGSLIPSTDGTVNLGSPSYQWNNAYIKSLTINGVACGDILTHNASEFAYDTNVVHKSGDETIRGNKHFNGNYVDVNGYRLRIKNTVEVAGELPTAENPWTSNRWTGFNFVDKNNVRTFEIARGNINNGWTFLNFGILNNASNTWLEFLKYEGNSSVSYVSSIDFFPMSNDTYELGSSTNKWKSFNGLNPGALSLWSGNYISLDTTEFDVTSTTIGTFASTVDGWATLVIGQNNKPFGIWLIGGTVRESFYSVKNNDNYFVFALIPVRANVNMTIYCTADDIDSTRRVSWLRVSPCQGNV